MLNLKIAETFRNLSQLFEIRQDNPFRTRAYERAAQAIEGLNEDIEIIAQEGRLREIPGIGEDLERKINEFIGTGKVRAYEELKKSFPDGLLELLRVPSVGPKTAKLLYDELRIQNVAGLESAIAKGKLKGIFGIKEKTIENITAGISLFKAGKERMPLSVAWQVAESFLKPLQDLPGVKKISCAGSLRRQKETIKDIDILIVSEKPQKIMHHFTSLPQVQEVIASGSTKSSVRTDDGIQVDCRVVMEKSFGAALLYFTGSKNFNIKLRQIAIRKSLKINEYGVFRGKAFVAGRKEGEIFKLLGMEYIEPELREDTGEIELARKGKLPKLITQDDLRGDLHTHSSWSDGNHTIQEMAHAAIRQGYSYIAVTDHSQGLTIANGLSVKDLLKKKREIEKVNNTLRRCKVLYGTEVDIDSQGGLDYPDEILKEFDIVIAAIHSGFKQSKEKLTHRMLKACDNKYVHIISHPTGRLWGTRNAYEIDFDAILTQAKDTNTALEINSFPLRLDLNDSHCRRAKERGVKLAINTDSHSIEHLQAARFGIAVARRGWLTSKDVLNTLPLGELLKAINK
ncbi:MAG: DNA polymerase/3'-5' exonuclease PolX [Candidatus Omnitrophota bacterium]|jgi:DNA polymerase (family 10)|nr:MAG: DNA polymerase/3'-5' exonuclease PolX [Candidatus Omnitrophota bacterium]